MCESAGIEYRKFHHIRHTVASLLIDADVSPKDVQYQLGHHSAQFTLDLYAKKVEKKEAVTACLDTVVSNG